MTLESIMNFEVGHRVKLNPDNHGFQRGGTALKKALARTGTIRVIGSEGVAKEGKFLYVRSGKISVNWDEDFSTRIYNYQNLIII